MYKTTMPAIMLKINCNQDADELREIYSEEPMSEWEGTHKLFLNPFLMYLGHKSSRKEPVIVKHYSMGLHTLGEAKKCHYHINIQCDKEPSNILANFKYFYRHKYLVHVMPELAVKKPEYLNQLSSAHFKAYTHSVKTDKVDDLKGFLSYPYKECIDDSTSWKASYGDMIEPFTRQELMNYGSGVYLAACRQREKTVKKEELKLEKWGHFCKYMDDLRETPTVNVMGDLKGVCLVALEYFRQLPERTSVNAVITMCKDYAFKRGIWTDQQILDKYQIS